MKTTSDPIRLDDPRYIPNPILERLVKVAPMFHDVEFMEELIKVPAFWSIAQDLEAYIIKKRVRGYHCTKEK